MRLNTGTIVLILVALVVIVAVLFISNQPDAGTGDPTATPATVSGPVFGGVDPLTVSQVRVVNFETNEYVTLTRDAGGAWTIGGSFSSTQTPPLQDAITTSVGTVTTLAYTDSFPGDDLAAFGLNSPSHLLTLYTNNGGEYQLIIGGLNPGGNRYYAVIQATPGEGTAEPFSAPVSTPGAAEATADATELAEAVLEAVAEVTAEATVEAAAEVTAEATVEVVPTRDLFTGDRPVLTGGQTIVLVNKAVIDPLLGLIAVPPYAPTATPLPPPTATPNPFSEVEMTATAASALATLNASINATATSMAQITPEVTAEVTVEVTAEATAAP